MALNPAKITESLNSPTQRASEVNDPQFENQQGYFPYDLTHQEFVSPRFGEITPIMHLDTVPGDRIVVSHDSKAIHNQINSNFLSKLNQYIDDFYVPLRAVFPENYEKLIPNPTKGQDLPNSALPQVPFNLFIQEYLASNSIRVAIKSDSYDEIYPVSNLMDLMTDFDPGDESQYDRWSVAIGRMTLIATVLSRGQLLDYLGCCFDSSGVRIGQLQQYIDTFIRNLYEYSVFVQSGQHYSTTLDLDTDTIYFDEEHTYNDANIVAFKTLSDFRHAISTVLERGNLYVPFFSNDPDAEELRFGVESSYGDLYAELLSLFSTDLDSGSFISNVDSSSDPFRTGFLSMVKPLAYQQVVAQYFTNNSVDNIFNSDLFMQSLRAVMFPSSSDGFSSEPTFRYNGVTTEYDYISCGGFYHALINSNRPGVFNRQYVWCTVMLLLRRSLRYGDKFATARPRMLAVGDLAVNVEQGSVSPIDITKNLLMQRYLNAVNYIGSGFLQYMTSIYGVRPSDTGTFPRFISHQQVKFDNKITNNTSDNQGHQTTNLVGFSDNQAFDVFIDDLGVVISLVTYDVLPVYTSGIDECYHLADRFDYFNPMLQGIGDQPIRLSEIVGNPELRGQTFGFTMRNGELKFKVSRAHGAFLRSLPGHILAFPIEHYVGEDPHIDPDFIRDAPVYMDSVCPQMTGVSPAEYYHFICSATNQVKCARKIQATPPVLF